jgi:peptidyl-prolyl cis-trans isomerase SurA
MIILLLFTKSNCYANYKKIDAIVAIAENDIILESELVKEAFNIKNNLISNSRKLPDDEIIISQALEKLIIQSLQLQKAKNIGLHINDQQLNDAITNIAQRNGLSLADFKLAIEKSGKSYLEVRKDIRNDLIIREIQRRNVISNLKITEKEINNFINSEKGRTLLDEEYLIDHILLPISENLDTPLKLKEEEKLLHFKKNILMDNDFSLLQEEIKNINAEYSPLGWRKISDVPGIFKQIIKALDIDEVSDIIFSDSGMHLIKIKKKRGGFAQSLVETNVRHILVAPNEIRSNDQAKKIIQKVYDELTEGVNFSLLARQYSDDPGSALSGGNLGWTKPGVLVPIFEKQMNETAIGSISPIFETNYGWHFLEVIDRRTVNLSQEKLLESARMAIAESKYDSALNNWLQELRDNSFVHIKKSDKLNI